MIAENGVVVSFLDIVEQDLSYNFSRFKMMKVPTCLVFPQLSASIPEFQLQNFPIVPCGLNRTWFKPVMLE
jgi:hypothetical protein